MAKKKFQLRNPPQARSRIGKSSKCLRARMHPLVSESCKILTSTNAASFGQNNNPSGTHDAHPFGLNREKKILTSDHARTRILWPQQEEKEFCSRFHSRDSFVSLFLWLERSSWFTCHGTELARELAIL